jgi:hypothetical protein
MVGRGMQDVEVTARWHNIWLGCTVLFFATTVLFSGLFGGYYSAWKNRPPCNDGQFWVFGNGTEFDDACHVVTDDGLYAIEGATCPTECDKWWHKQHPTIAANDRRRLASGLPRERYAKIVTPSISFKRGSCDCNNTYSSTYNSHGTSEYQMRPYTKCNNGTLLTGNNELLDCGIPTDPIILVCNPWVAAGGNNYICNS